MSKAVNEGEGWSHLTAGSTQTQAWLFETGCPSSVNAHCTSLRTQRNGTEASKSYTEEPTLSNRQKCCSPDQMLEEMTPQATSS